MLMQCIIEYYRKGTSPVSGRPSYQWPDIHIGTDYQNEREPNIRKIPETEISKHRSEVGSEAKCFWARLEERRRMILARSSLGLCRLAMQGQASLIQRLVRLTNVLWALGQSQISHRRDEESGDGPPCQGCGG